MWERLSLFFWLCIIRPIDRQIIHCPDRTLTAKLNKLFVVCQVHLRGLQDLCPRIFNAENATLPGSLLGRLEMVGDVLESTGASNSSEDESITIFCSELRHYSFDSTMPIIPKTPLTW
jgi:hypothetical protein